MKKMILATACAAMLAIFARPALGNPDGRFVGIWQATSTINGVFFHDIMILRQNGTGENTTYGGPVPIQAVFNWEPINGVFYKYYPDGTVGRGKIRRAGPKTVYITPLDYYHRPNGPELKYEKVDPNYDEGC